MNIYDPPKKKKRKIKKMNQQKQNVTYRLQKMMMKWYQLFLETHGR